MFTGIIQEIGTVSSTVHAGGGILLTVDAPRSTSELDIDDSVALSGVCQTVIMRMGTSFQVQAVEETLKKTALGMLKTNSKVNIELPVRLSDRLGGHLVLGHVDTTGLVKKIEKMESSVIVTVSYGKEFGRYCIPVGSIAIDGVSLTIASLQDETLAVSLIPHTLENTTLGELAEGSKVNLEFDLIGKYIERLLTKGGPGESNLTWEKIREWGYGD